MRSLAIAGLLLVLSAAPAAAQAAPPTPAAYTLASGVACHWANGATSSVSDARANFHCDDDTWLWGFPYTLGDELVMLHGGVPTPDWATPLLSSMDLVVVSAA